MTKQSKFLVLFFVATLAAGNTVHWIITPMAHPNASDTRTALVYVQLLATVAVSVFAFRRYREAVRTA